MTDIIFQLEHIIEDVNGWECSNINPESLQDVLLPQVQRQMDELTEYLDSKVIDPAWDIEAIYHALAKERIDAIKKKSIDWLDRRNQLMDRIETLVLNEVEALNKDLMSPPVYISNDHLSRIQEHQVLSGECVCILKEELRRSTASSWQKPFYKLKNIEGMTKYEIEKVLKALTNPPVALTVEEKQSLAKVEETLVFRLDQMSVNEIINRIEKLSVKAKTEIFNLLKRFLVL